MALTYTRPPRPSDGRSTPQHLRDGLQDQGEVEPGGPVGDVAVVERDHVFEGQVAAAVDLPEAGHAGLELEPPAPPLRHVQVLLEDQGPGADERHLAAEHIEELWQL